VLEVKRRAGHTRSTFTLDRYGHLFPDADEGLAARLDSLYGQQEPPDSDKEQRLSSWPRVLSVSRALEVTGPETTFPPVKRGGP
jgi:hypothetical protein